MCPSEISARFDVMLSTTKIEYKTGWAYYFNLVVVCVWLKTLLAVCGELLVEHVSFSMIHLSFYKQLGSGPSPQSCLYFQGVHGSKLLNVCLEVWPSNLFLREIQ